MAKYGKAAVAAVQMLHKGQVKHAPDAWDAAVKQIFPDSLTSQVKNCPRSAFLGLCEAGLVKGVPSGSYTRSLLNKKYAVDAVNELLARPTLVDNPDQIWRLVVGSTAKAQNSQMEVVIALWRQEFIAR